MYVFVAGGTGYIGRPVIGELVKRGHSVAALVRPGSEGRLPPGATPVRHLESQLHLAVMVALVPEHVLEQEDRVVVVEIHVPACLQPALYRVPHRLGNRDRQTILSRGFNANQRQARVEVSCPIHNRFPSGSS